MPVTKPTAKNVKELAQMTQAQDPSGQVSEQMHEISESQLDPKIQADLQRNRSAFMAAQEAESNAKIAALGLAPLPFSVEAQTSQYAAAEPTLGDKTQEIDPLAASYKERKIQLWDGRVITMGPPGIWEELILQEVFEKDSSVGNKLNSRRQIAICMQYVRMIDNRRLPPALTTWAEIENLVRELTPLGCNAVREAYLETWTSIGGLYWSDVKKNVPESGISDQDSA